MKKYIIIGLAILTIGLGAFAYSVFKPPEEASAPIQAAPVVVNTSVPEPTVTSQSAATEAAVEVEFVPTAEPTVEVIVESEENVVQQSSPTSGILVYQISQEESEARFIIDEILRGNPFTVVGTTNQVAGEIALDAGNPAAAQIGEILINARTLTTDNEFRNRALKNRILVTDQFEFIIFTPTELAGLPDNIVEGESYAFQILGELTVRDKTLPATFEVTATLQADNRLEGLAATTILYQDYDIVIPNSPAVASVSDEVILELAFAAVVE